MRATHKSAEDRHEIYRVQAREYAQNALPVELKNKVTFRGIDFRALVQAKAWVSHASRKNDWDWQGEYGLYSFTNPKRFELSIWCDHTLCAIALGRPTWSGNRIRLDAVEASPENHPLRKKVIPLTVLALEEYAEQVGADEIRIMNPVNEQVCEYYVSLGFVYNQKEDYCWRKVI